MSGTNLLMPTLDASDKAAGVAATRMRRHFIVAAVLIGSDLGSGLPAVQVTSWLSHDRFTIGVSAVPVLVLVYWALDLYGGFGPCPFERLRLRAKGIALLIIIDCAAGMVMGEPPRLRFLVPACASLLLVGYYVEIYARALLIRRGLWGASVVFVGAGRRSAQLAKYLEDHPEFGLRPAGFACTGEDDAVQMPAFLPALGGPADLERMAESVELLIFESAADKMALGPSLRRRLTAKQLVMVGDPQHLPSLWLTTRSLGGLIGVELPQGAKWWNQQFKRLLDLLVAIPASILASPIIILAALAIKAVDPGPAFYFQDRVGINGRTIRVCKLRTMFKDAESRLQEHLARDPQAAAEWQRFFKLSHDPRILPVIGTLLRRTSLDELPQLRNVLFGQMSLIGPRPFPAYHVHSFDREFQDIRCTVPPGLSGLWQVAARSNGDLDVQREQDLFYILNWSIWLDLYILIETPIAVLAARGAK